MSGCSVLVVDDDPSIHETVAEFLDMEGYPVATAANGAEALAAIEREPPCVVVLDMRMPVLNGWEFMRIAHERALPQEVLVMTAAQDARRWAREVDAAGFVAKPFDLDDLLAAVERVCAIRDRRVAEDGEGDDRGA